MQLLTHAILDADELNIRDNTTRFECIRAPILCNCFMIVYDSHQAFPYAKYDCAETRGFRHLKAKGIKTVAALVSFLNQHGSQKAALALRTLNVRRSSNRGSSRLRCQNLHSPGRESIEAIEDCNDRRQSQQMGSLSFQSRVLHDACD